MSRWPALHLPEAIGAIDRLIAPRLKRNLASLAAFGTGGIIHLSASVHLLFFLSPAVRTSRRRISKTLLTIKFLFTRRPDKLLAAVTAG